MRGFQFEAADGSLELLMRKEAGEYEPLFRLESWRVRVEKRADGKVETEATIKIWVQGERYLRTAEGNGPVNALDKALRDAIGEIYPHLHDIDLDNFKVRILDETSGTGAVTRVLIDASDGQEVWGHRGLGEPDRRLLGCARRLPRVRDAARPAPRRGGKRGSPTRLVSDAREVPLARPVLGEAEERASSRCCAPDSSRSDRASAVRADSSPRAWAQHAGQRRHQRHRRAASRAASGRGQGRR